MSADEGLAQENAASGAKPGPEPATRTQAVAWLQDLLAAGPMESAQVKVEAKDAGYSWRTIHRAKDEFGVKPYRQQFGGVWMWMLTSSPLPCNPSQEQENLASWHHSRFSPKNGDSAVPNFLSCQVTPLGMLGNESSTADQNGEGRIGPSNAGS